jgi:hypothetical protein
MTSSLWAIDHTTCPRANHDREASDDDLEFGHDLFGQLACQHCGAPVFYCTTDEAYHHLDPFHPACFLITD